MRYVDARMHGRAHACADVDADGCFNSDIREFKDVVFEAVVFDNDSCVTIYCGGLCYYCW